MVAVEDLLFRQGQLETEILCLQDAIQRLTQRIFVLENFIKLKHGELALDDTVLLDPEDVPLIPDDPNAPTKESDQDNFVGDFSEFFLSGTSTILTGQGEEFIITTHQDSPEDPSILLEERCSQNVPQGVEIGSNEELADENMEIVPDAVREETVSINGATVNLLGVYDSNGINLLDNEGEETVIYDIIPSTLTYEQDSSSSEQVLLPNKHTGTIRIYKPELKSFTRFPSGLESDTELLTPDPKHVCQVCQKIFLDEESMQRHFLLHSVIRFRCDECDRDFKNLHNLNLHKGKHERLRQRRFQKSAPSTISDCDNVIHITEAEKYETSPDLICSSPADRIFSVSPYVVQCRMCDLHFETQALCLDHEKTHKEEVRPFICDVCGLSFRNRSGLADHFIGHKGQRNHLCHICPAGFLRSRNLLKHIRFVHSLVQIKTVLEDGNRVVEFVGPEMAEKLVEERKHNVESKDSKARRLAGARIVKSQITDCNTYNNDKDKIGHSSNKNTLTKNTKRKLPTTEREASFSETKLQRRSVSSGSELEGEEPEETAVIALIPESLTVGNVEAEHFIQAILSDNCFAKSDETMDNG